MAQLSPSKAAVQAAAPALEVSGCQSKYKLINGAYERLPTDHHGKPAYVTRGETNCYIFHTGKSRWVISKRIDDGARCYAFKKDDPPSNDPSECTGPWTTCGSDNQWTEESSISCRSIQKSNDVFVKMRLSVEDEMTKYGLTETNCLKQLWRRLDFNGNGVVSLAEVDKLVVEMCQGGSWPPWLNNKPALMRAFTKAKCGQDGRRGDFVEKCEFHDLLLNLFWFNKLYQVFESIDDDKDRRINMQEFVRGASQLGLQPDEAKKVFNETDTNHGGEVLFVEFCAEIRHRVNPDDNPAFDSDIISGEKAGSTLRKKHGDTITHSHYVNKKTLKSFDDLEAKIKQTFSDNAALGKLWHEIDFNGNNVVSLAEIDKFAVEKYPILNHKPALMRAYKKSVEAEKDQFVHKRDFKKMLGNIFYFNKLFWLFDAVDEDHDRRLTVDEFKWCLTTAGVKMAEPRVVADFQQLAGKNRSTGTAAQHVMFDEFCLYFTKKMCPEALADFAEVGDPQGPQSRT